MNPPVRDFYFTPQRASFLGPAILYDEITREGFECKIFNGCSEKSRPTQLPEELSYLAPHLGKEGFFKHYYRFGKLPKNLADEVIQWQPNVIFISLFAFCYALEAIEVVEALRMAGYNSTIILGGAGISAYPEYFLRFTSANFVFCGEADHAIKNILHAPKRTAGMWYCEKEEIVHTQSPTVHNFLPATVPMRKSSTVQYYSAIFTRGCPMKCGFCSSRLHMPLFRKASLASIQELLEKTAWNNASHLNIEDDAIVWDFEYFIEIIKFYKMFAGRNATFSLENGIDYRALDKGKIQAMAELGLSKLNIALVSTDNHVLKHYGRNTLVEKFAEIVEAAHKSGIPTTAYIIAGLKGDTYEGIMKSLRFLSSLPVLIGISPFYPVPGIQGFEDKHFFDSISPRLCAGTSFYPWHDLTTDELVQLFCEARNINIQKAFAS